MIIFGFKPVGEFPLEIAMNMMNRAFDGYLAGSFTFTLPAFLQFLARSNVDLYLSKLLFQDDEPIGLGLVSRQGWTSRLVTMGIVPEARNQSAGGALLETLLTDAQNRGDKRYVLEVFEQNTPALKLYERVGFQVMRRLWGYQAENVVSESGHATNLEQVDIIEIAKMILQHGLENLPAQTDGMYIAQLNPPHEAYHLGSAGIVIVPIGADGLRLSSIIVPEKDRLQGVARRIIDAVAQKYPNRTWHIPQISPDEMDGFFQKMGFVRHELNQFQMEIHFTI